MPRVQKLWGQTPTKVSCCSGKADLHGTPAVVFPGLTSVTAR
jgi:hypothetical protein